MAVNDDADLRSQARQAAGATDAAAIPDKAIQRELDGVKETVTAEIQEALNSSTISLYETDAPLKLAENLLKLRVADLRRKAEPAARPKVPADPVPTGFGRLQRHDFEDQTLGHWRDQALRHRRRITDG